MLEYWIPFSKIEYTHSLGIWCDGIPLLTVASIHRTAFLVVGVGYFPDALSPFELEFHYKHRRDLYTTKVVFRFGIASGRSFSRHEDPNIILMHRPRVDQQWAVAVELTPLDT